MLNAYITRGGYMLQIKNLTIHLKKDLRNIIENLSFHLNYGDKVAIIGKEGNGKSTLLKAIYDTSLIESYSEISGKINKKQEVISYLPQSFSSEVLNKRAEDLLCIDEYFDYSTYYHYMHYFNLDEKTILDNKAFSNFSGGEKIKFFIILCMLKNPTVLLLDEPSNDLDIMTLKVLEQFIKDVDIPIMFISHDEHLLKKCATSVIHLEQLPEGRARHRVSSLRYEEYVANLDKSIKKQTQLAKKEKEEFNRQMETYHKIKDKVHHELNSTKNGAMGKHFEKNKEKLTKAPVLESDIYLTFSEEIGFHNKKSIIDFHMDFLKIDNRVLSKNIHLNIKGQEKICIIGQNGVGKTTLLEEVVEELKQRNIRCYYMPQNYDNSLEFDQNPIEFLTTDFSKEENLRICNYLASLNYSREEMTRNISTLSGGQKCELFFAKMMIGQYDFLILDEPTRNLSPISSQKVRTSLKNYSGGILAVSHDVAFINDIFDTVYLMRKEGLQEVDITTYL